MEWTEWNTNDRARKEKKREEKEKKREGRKERKSTSRLEIAALGESVDVLFAFCEIRFLGKGERERDKLASG